MKRRDFEKKLSGHIVAVADFSTPDKWGYFDLRGITPEEMGDPERGWMCPYSALDVDCLGHEGVMSLTAEDKIFFPAGTKLSWRRDGFFPGWLLSKAIPVDETGEPLTIEIYEMVGGGHEGYGAMRTVVGYGRI